MKRMFLTLLLGGMTLSAVAGPAEVTDEARLLRFPATNGTDVVFSTPATCSRLRLPVARHAD